MNYRFHSEISSVPIHSRRRCITKIEDNILTSDSTSGYKMSWIYRDIKKFAFVASLFTYMYSRSMDGPKVPKVRHFDKRTMNVRQVDIHGRILNSNDLIINRCPNDRNKFHAAFIGIKIPYKNSYVSKKKKSTMRILFFLRFTRRKIQSRSPERVSDLQVTELVQTDINRPTYKEISNLRL